MRLATLLFFAFLFSAIVSFAQEYVNPFLNDRNQFNQRDIITIVERDNATKQRLFVYDWTTAIGDQSPDFSALIPMGDDPLGISEQAVIADQKRMIIETGNFNNNLLDDVFYLFEHSGTWHYGAAEQGVYWDSLSTSTNVIQEIPQLYTAGDIGTYSSYPCLTIGDFDGDGDDEVAVAFTEEFESLVFVQIVDPVFDGDQFVPSIFGPFNIDIPCDKLANDINYTSLSLTSGDYNGDGTDELAIGGLVENGSAYDAFVQIIDVSEDGEYAIDIKGYEVFNNSLTGTFDEENPSQGVVNYARTALTSARSYTTFSEGGTEQICAMLGIHRNFDFGMNYTFLNAHSLTISADLETITVGEAVEVENSGGTTLSVLGSFEAKVGDVSNDNQDDVVLLCDSYVIFTYESGELVLKYDAGAGPMLSEENSPVQESSDRFDIGDIDRDGFEDIVSFSRTFNGTFAQYHTEAFQIKLVVDESQFGMDPNDPWTLEKTGQYFEEFQEGNSLTYYAFDMGNLDGNDVRLGEPTILSCDYVKPNVILESIPHHFDYFEGDELAVLGPEWVGVQILDINDCWEGGCANRVSYNEVQESGETNSNTYTSAWSVSATASISAPTGPIGMNASLTYQYGEQFSKTYTEAASNSVSVTNFALTDDLIMYQGYPVLLYEYPVLSAEGEIVNYISAAFPAAPLEQDNNASKDLENYLPNHEPGNVLSYPYEPNPNSDADFYYDVDPALGALPLIWISQSIDVTQGVGTELSLSFQEEIITEESTQTEESISLTVGASGFGYGAEVTGTYTETNLDVFGQSISTLDSYTFVPGELADGLSSGDFKYEFRTVMYWNYMNGAKLGMKVTSLDGSRWNQIYGQKVDPALNLPWRLDYLKFSTKQEANRYRTKSMRFDKINPQVNDTVTVYTRLFNYSLLNMTDSIPYQLFAGDPNEGGEIIADLNGNTLHYSPEILLRQDQAEDSVAFVVTLGMLEDAENRIYIVLDPFNQFDETHEDNNYGWTNLGFACNVIDISTGLNEVLISSDRISIQAFPNPTTDQINFDFSESLSYLNQNLRIRIMDISGKVVIDDLLNGQQGGRYSYNVNSLGTGIYIYQIYTPNQILFNERFVKSKQ